jgi:hypothetical protein
MRKTISLALLLMMIIFMIVTFATKQYQINANDMDQFGYPFVFFTSANNAEIKNITSFSGSALLCDLGICAVASLIIIYIFSFIKNIKRVHHT